MRMTPVNPLIDRMEQLVVCPVCKKKLTKTNQRVYVCSGCERGYPFEDGILTLVSPDLPHDKLMEAEWHDKAADSYAEKHQFNTPKVAHYVSDTLSPILALPQKSLILEIGCGTGEAGTRLLERHYVVEADISRGMLLKALRQQSNPNAMYVLADAEDIPFESGSFDAVYVDATLHHLPNPLAGVKEITRVVKRGGLIVVASEPNRWPLKVVRPWARLLRRRSSVMDAKTNGFGYEEMRGLLSSPELSIVKLGPMWYISGFVFGLQGVLGRKFLPSFIDRFFVFVDEMIGKTPLLRRYGWHWTAIALKGNGPQSGQSEQDPESARRSPLGNPTNQT